MVRANNNNATLNPLMIYIFVYCELPNLYKVILTFNQQIIV